jgi:hypothetical protein
LLTPSGTFGFFLDPSGGGGATFLLILSNKEKHEFT